MLKLLCLLPSHAVEESIGAERDGRIGLAKHHSSVPAQRHPRNPTITSARVN